MRLLLQSGMLLAMVFSGGCKGCGRKPPSSQRSAPMQFYQNYRKRLPNASSDSERRQLTLDYLREAKTTQVTAFNEEQRIKGQILGPSPLGELWLEHYPNVTANLAFSIGDLETLGKQLDRDRRSPHQAAERTPRENARAWLLQLTGQEFAARKQFEVWLEANREDLKWHQAAGRFVLD